MRFKKNIGAITTFTIKVKPVTSANGNEASLIEITSNNIVNIEDWNMYRKTTEVFFLHICMKTTDTKIIISMKYRNWDEARNIIILSR